MNHLTGTNALNERSSEERITEKQVTNQLISELSLKGERPVEASPETAYFTPIQENRQAGITAPLLQITLPPAGRTCKGHLT